MATDNEPRDAYTTALRMLGTRDLSESQLRTRLTRKGCLPDDIERAIATLREKKYVDDRRVADAIARTQTVVQLRGKSRVKRQIQQAGISSEVAARATEQAFGAVDQEALLEQALQKRLRGRPIEDEKAFRRLYRYMVGQGFDHGRVMQALRRHRGTAAVIPEDTDLVE